MTLMAVGKTPQVWAAGVEEYERKPELGELARIDAVEGGHDAGGYADDHQADEADRDGMADGTEVGMGEVQPRRLAGGGQPRNQDTLMHGE